jgi:phospholipid transport system substrate-binding protein
VYRLFFTLLLMGAIPQAQAQAPDPQAMVKETSNRVLAEIAYRKQELTDFPERIYPLVEEIVLPRFDFVRISRLVLGKHWRRSTPAQQDAFVQAFRQLMVRTYATVLLNYSGQEIVYLPLLGGEQGERITVRTELNNEGAPAVPIHYKLYFNQAEWRVYDLVVDGVSLVSNYRTGFASEIRREKLDGLIARLQARNRGEK